jgi:hypothetical protein
MTVRYQNWRTSSYTSPDGECVEVAKAADGTIGVRDTKDYGTGPILQFTVAEWAALLDRLRRPVD